MTDILITFLDGSIERVFCRTYSADHALLLVYAEKQHGEWGWIYYPLANIKKFELLEE